jgi:hypothetical protein
LALLGYDDRNSQKPHKRFAYLSRQVYLDFSEAVRAFEKDDVQLESYIYLQPIPINIQLNFQSILSLFFRFGTFLCKELIRKSFINRVLRWERSDVAALVSDISMVIGDYLFDIL